MVCLHSSKTAILISRKQKLVVRVLYCLSVSYVFLLRLISLFYITLMQYFLLSNGVASLQVMF